MQSTIEYIEDIISKTGDILETKGELLKLKTAGRISETVSSLISIFVIAAITIIAIIILSIGISFGIGLALNSIPAGFFIIGGVYIVAALVVYYFRKKIIKTPICNLLINKMMGK